MNKATALHVFKYLYNMFLREELVRLAAKTDTKIDDKLIEVFDALVEYIAPFIKKDDK